MSATNSSGGTRSITLLTATCLVVANMVGTGVFTSLGFQVGGLPSGFAILVLWLVGGICAFCGALAYGELAAALPRSGGEYHYLSAIYHPAVGFLAGWISATVGFAAPVALAAMAFGTYFQGVLPGANALFLSLVAVWITTLMLLRDLRLGSFFQNGSTLLKVALVVAIIIAGCMAGHAQPVSFLPAAGDARLIFSAPFAINLVFVMYAYSGWNASTYIVGEMRNPARNVPLSVGLGTVAVIALYLALNAVFLATTPIAEMSASPDKIGVALVAGPHIFGTSGTAVMAALICVGLISTIAAMMWIGPRVTMAMGEDVRLLGFLARKSARGVPVPAILVQCLIVHVMLFTGTFEKVLTYIQFSLTFCSFLTVLGVFVLRVRQPALRRPYKTWGYPITPLIFLAVSGWMMWQILQFHRNESLAGLGTMLLGLLLYFVSSKGGADTRAPSAMRMTEGE